MGLFDVFTGSSGVEGARKAAKARNAGYEKGYGLASGDLNQAKTEGLGYLNQGIAPQQALFNQGQQGVDYYGSLVGLPGSNGAGVQQTLQNIPGYQFAMNQGLDALNRTANSRGMLASGNNTQDILKYSQGLADQNYFNYLNSVQPYFGLGQNAAQGMQSGYTNKSNLASNIGSQLAGYGWNKETGIGNSNAQKFQDIAAAQQAGSGNLWSAILGLGSAALSGGLF